MTDMIERVAKVIRDTQTDVNGAIPDLYDFVWHTCTDNTDEIAPITEKVSRNFAHAVLKAIREPTEEMNWAGTRAFNEFFNPVSKESRDDGHITEIDLALTAAIFQAMIDTALKEDAPAQ